MVKRFEKGQSLIELIIALGIGVAMMSVASSGLFLVLRSGQLAQQNEVSSNLAGSLIDGVAAVSQGNWHSIYDLNKGSSNHYRVSTSTGQLAIQSGDENLTVNGTSFTRYFYADNVSRDGSGNIESVYNSLNDDPSTQKITSTASSQIGGSPLIVSSIIYITRSQNFVFKQTDWSGGSGQEGPITSINNKFASSANIDFSNTPGSIFPIPTNLNYIYVADTNNNRIQKFDSSGNYVSKWGSSGSGDGQFQHPQGIGRDSAYNLYVADTNNHRIQKFDNAGNFLLKWGSHGNGDGQFDQPRDLAIDSANNIYVIDFLNDRVEKFDSSGNFLIKWGSQGSTDGKFKDPEGIAVDSNNNVYVADTKNDRIQKFNSSGTFLLKWGSTGSGNGQFENPTGISVDSSNNIFVADSNNQRVQKFDSNGNFLSKWGGSGNGDGQFGSPADMVIDSQNFVYVVDAQNNNVQKFNSSGTFILKWGSQGSTDGKFQSPTGIASSLAQCTGASEECNLVSSVFDTGVVSGAGLNTIMWQGSQISGQVIFKIASSNNSAGPWNYSSAINVSGPNVQVKIDPSLSNKRYVRYKLIMDSNQSNSPRIDDVILSWSR